MNELYIQGDVSLQKIEEIPNDAKVKEKGSIVLAYGETTGHKHQIGQATLLVTEASQEFLQVDKPTELVHEEHGKIEVPAGKYLVVRQREYTPEAPRTITD